MYKTTRTIEIIKMSDIQENEIHRLNIPVSELNKLIASCDERIASVQAQLDTWKPYEMMMGLMEHIHDKEEDKKVFSEAPHREETKNNENNIKLISVEKMMWNAMKNNSRREIFKHILAKYDELLLVSYDLSGNMVVNEILQEGKYLSFCKESLEQREFIRKMCCVGYGGYLE